MKKILSSNFDISIRDVNGNVTTITDNSINASGFEHDFYIETGRTFPEVTPARIKRGVVYKEASHTELDSIPQKYAHLFNEGFVYKFREAQSNISLVTPKRPSILRGIDLRK